MTEPTEPDLIRSDAEAAPPDLAPHSSDPRRLAAMAAVVVLLLLGLGYWLTRRPAPVREAVATSGSTAGNDVPAPASSLGGNPFPADVPSLDLSDPFVRTWLPKLSSHPRVAAWLTTNGLVRNFVTVVSNIAEGKTPAGRVPVLKPSGTFQVVERGGHLYVDPRSYERYNDLAAAFASIDAAGAAQLYATLKPRLEEASGELGASGSFDATLEQAIAALLRTPVRDQPPAVEPFGIGYRYVDDQLAALNGAQQHLLRMGPANARLVQRQLRELALALGIPASRLPPA